MARPSLTVPLAKYFPKRPGLLAVALGLGLLQACQVPVLKDPVVKAPAVTDTAEDAAKAQAGSDELPPFSAAAVDSADGKPQSEAGDGQNKVADLLASLDQEELEEEVIRLSPPDGLLEDDKTRVAILLPLSTQGNSRGDRELRDLAQGLLDSAQLALFDQRNETVALMPHDTRGTVDGAEQAARDAIAEGADIIIGPLLSSSVEAVAPVARQADVKVISFSNRPQVAGEGVYIIGFALQQQVDRLVAHALGEGLGRFAILTPESPYGQAVLEAFRNAVATQGGSIQRIGLYDPVATDFGPQIKEISNYDARRYALTSRVKELQARDDEVSRLALKQLAKRDTLGDVDFEAILLPAQDELTLRTIASQLAQYDVDQPAVRYLGLQLWDNFGNLSSEPPLIGGRYVAPPPEGRGLFAKRYQKVFRQAPHPLASLAYDAMALAVIQAGAEGVPDYSDRALTNNVGFFGVDGIFRLTRSGITERGMAVVEIGREGLTTIDAAPQRF